MGVYNFPAVEVVPSDVFGREVDTDVGYGRETFVIPVDSGKKVRVGTLLSVDYVTKTATIVPADITITALNAIANLGVFVGRDLPTNPTDAQDFSRLTQTTTGKGVAIVKGDGSGVIGLNYLDVGGTLFYDIATAGVQATIIAKLTNQNRFKCLDGVKPSL